MALVDRSNEPGEAIVSAMSLPMVQMDCTQPIVHIHIQSDDDRREEDVVAARVEGDAVRVKSSPSTTQDTTSRDAMNDGAAAVDCPPQRGDFEDIEVLGSGSFGSVLLAVNRKTGQKVHILHSFAFFLKTASKLWKGHRTVNWRHNLLQPTHARLPASCPLGCVEDLGQKTTQHEETVRARHGTTAIATSIHNFPSCNIILNCQHGQGTVSCHEPLY